MDNVKRDIIAVHRKNILNLCNVISISNNLVTNEENIKSILYSLDRIIEVSVHGTQEEQRRGTKNEM